jgi:hypothetical protein
MAAGSNIPPGRHAWPWCHLHISVFSYEFGYFFPWVQAILAHSNWDKAPEKNHRKPQLLQYVYGQNITAYICRFYRQGDARTQHPPAGNLQLQDGITRLCSGYQNRRVQVDVIQEDFSVQGDMQPSFLRFRWYYSNQFPLDQSWIIQQAYHPCHVCAALSYFYCWIANP